MIRDLVHAPVKRSVLIPDATHFVLFEKNRFQFFEEVLNFRKAVTLINLIDARGIDFAAGVLLPSACCRQGISPTHGFSGHCPLAHAFRLLSACRHSIDKQAALGDHTILGGKTLHYLHDLAIGEPDLDPSQLDRVVGVAHRPDADCVAFVDNGITRDRDRIVAFPGEDLHTREHFRLE